MVKITFCLLKLSESSANPLNNTTTWDNLLLSMCSLTGLNPIEPWTGPSLPNSIQPALDCAFSAPPFIHRWRGPIAMIKGT